MQKNKENYNEAKENDEEINKYGFDKEGYFWEKQDDGTYKNTGLRYNKYGFQADMKHVITKNFIDLRGFNIDGKCKRNNDSIYDKNGFKQDGTYKETGEKYHNGYNAFFVNEEGKNTRGNIPRDIRFTKGYIDAIMSGNRIRFLERKYGTAINKEDYDKIMEKVNIKVYRATEMYPMLKREIGRKIMEISFQIWERKKRIEELKKNKECQNTEIDKLQKENEILYKRIKYMNPFKEIENKER